MRLCSIVLVFRWHVPSVHFVVLFGSIFAAHMCLVLLAACASSGFVALNVICDGRLFVCFRYGALCPHVLELKPAPSSTLPFPIVSGFLTHPMWLFCIRCNLRQAGFFFLVWCVGAVLILCSALVVRFLVSVLIKLSGFIDTMRSFLNPFGVGGCPFPSHSSKSLLSLIPLCVVWSWVSSFGANGCISQALRPSSFPDSVLYFSIRVDFPF